MTQQCEDDGNYYMGFDVGKTKKKVDEEQAGAREQIYEQYFPILFERGEKQRIHGRQDRGRNRSGGSISASMSSSKGKRHAARLLLGRRGERGRKPALLLRRRRQRAFLGRYERLHEGRSCSRGVPTRQIKSMTTSPSRPTRTLQASRCPNPMPTRPPRASRSCAPPPTPCAGMRRALR